MRQSGREIGARHAINLVASQRQPVVGFCVLQDGREPTAGPWCLSDTGTGPELSAECGASPHGLRRVARRAALPGDRAPDACHQAVEATGSDKGGFK